jgi:hypothetical protein
LRLKRLMQPRLDEPLPLWMIFPVVFAALYASHFTLLRLPYYWDEAGYYIPAAWDFFRTGSLIPSHHADQRASAAAQHLPGAVVEGFRLLSRGDARGSADGGGAGLLAVWRLAMRLVGVGSVAFWTVVLTGIYPIWFAQSTLAHADIFAAACTLWGLVYALPDRDRKPWAAALWFAAAALVQGDGDRRSADAGRGVRGGGNRARPPRAFGCGGRRRGFQAACCRWPAGTLSLREDRIPVRQSGVSALQRAGYA